MNNSLPVTFPIVEEHTLVNMLSTKSGFDNEVSPVRKQARLDNFFRTNSLPTTFLIVEDNTLVNCCLSTRSGFEKKKTCQKRSAMDNCF